MSKSPQTGTQTVQRLGAHAACGACELWGRWRPALRLAEAGLLKMSLWIWTWDPKDGWPFLAQSWLVFGFPVGLPWPRKASRKKHTQKSVPQHWGGQLGRSFWLSCKTRQRGLSSLTHAIGWYLKGTKRKPVAILGNRILF